MGSEDPYDPDYVPPVGGGRDVGDVGSGEDFGADTYRLYLAGRVFIPETAVLYADNTYTVKDIGSTAIKLAESHDAFRRMDTILERMHGALFRTAQSLNATAEALVQIADDYVRTDETARGEFRDLYKDDQTLEPDENSLPPLDPDNLPDQYVEPPSPDEYGEDPPPSGPGGI